MIVKKSIAIIGEGETEWFYFESVRTTKRYRFKMAPDFPSHSDIGHLIKLAQQYIRQQYDFVVCLVDMDRINTVPAEMERYKKMKAKRENKGIIFIETSPCTEYWFLLHFLPNLSTKAYANCDDLLPVLQQYIPGYEKTKKYLRSVDLFNYLCQNGDFERAKANAAKLCEMHDLAPDDIKSYTEVHKVFELLDKIEDTNK